MTAEHPPAVYYAINNAPKYLSYTAVSIESLLKYNQRVKIYLFIYGPVAEAELSFFRENNVCIINKKAVRDEYLTSLKWFSLKDLSTITEERLLFADADTFFFTDIERLFAIYNEADFYARQEAGTAGSSTEYAIGRYSFKSNLNQQSFNKIAAFLKCKTLPVFNSGLMLFNHGIFKKIQEHLLFYESLLNSFIDKKLPYPSPSSHIIDELASSLMLGKLEPFYYKLIDKEVSPWYIEFQEKTVDAPGMVLHIWNNYYSLFWEELGKNLSSFKNYQG